MNFLAAAIYRIAPMHHSYSILIGLLHPNPSEVSFLTAFFLFLRVFEFGLTLCHLGDHIFVNSLI